MRRATPNNCARLFQSLDGEHCLLTRSVSSIAWNAGEPLDSYAALPDEVVELPMARPVAKADSSGRPAGLKVRRVPADVVLLGHSLGCGLTGLSLGAAEA